MTASVPLAGGFAAVTEADWRASVAESTDDPDRQLASSSEDGIAVGPIYQRATSATAIAGRAAGRRWRAIQRVDAPDAVSALSWCREELAGGADGLALVFAESIHPLRSRMASESAAAMVAGLAEISASGAHLTIDAGPRSADVAAILASSAIKCELAFDPVAAVAAGRTTDADATMARLVELAGPIAGTLTLADGRIWHAAGASEAQELAAVLATVIEHLRLFDANGMPTDRTATRIAVALAADTDQFLAIAKFRAVRLLLARALEAAGIAAMPQVHAETSWRTMSRREPRMNVLRATGATFAAAVGGTDSITVLPFDALDGPSGDDARRLARNTQLVIAEEAQLHRFADPAAGSGAVEHLTDALAEKAWTRFQAIEAEGGILRVLATGALQAEIAATREARLARFAAGAIEMVGVNVFVGGDGEFPPAERAAPAEGALVFRRLAELAESAP